MVKTLNVFFLVQHIPAWFPGATFKTLAMEWKAAIERSVNVPYELCVEKLVGVRPSIPPPSTTHSAYDRVARRKGGRISSFDRSRRGSQPKPEGRF